jgi:protease I
MPSVNGLKIAILATDGFEQVELTEPRKALDQAGAQTSVVAPKAKGDEIRGWKFKEWGDRVKVDESLDGARPDDFDALVLQGGVMNPAICHGPWTIIETGAARGQNRVMAFRQNRPAQRGRGMGRLRSGR